MRTPIGRFGGALASLSAADLGTAAAKAALARAGLDVDAVDQVVFGHARQAGGGPNTARQIAFRSGVPQERPAFTVNQACGSGLQAVLCAARAIRLGEAEVVLAGGTESMSNTPYLLPRARWGYRLGHAEIVDGMYQDGFNDPLSKLVMGETAEELAVEAGIDRAAADEYAAETQRLCEEARRANRFASEIVPVEVPGKKGPTPFDKDEHNRPDTTLETLARLKPAFRPNGTITAGNAPGLNDAAAAMVLADGTWADKRGLVPTARLVAYGIAAVEPGMFGLGPVPAVKQALQRAGWDIRSIERAEINEAFAAIAIVVARELGLPEDVVNVEGGAVAHGHPIGATGAVLTTKLIHSMRRDGLTRGLVTLCIGGGQGIALAIETLH